EDRLEVGPVGRGPGVVRVGAGARLDARVIHQVGGDQRREEEALGPDEGPDGQLPGVEARRGRRVLEGVGGVVRHGRRPGREGQPAGSKAQRYIANSVSSPPPMVTASWIVLPSGNMSPTKNTSTPRAQANGQ